MANVSEFDIKKYASLEKEAVSNNKPEIIIAEKSDYEVVPEAIYTGVYLNATKRESEKGDYYIHEWGIVLRDGRETIITELSSTKLTQNTKLGSIFSVLGFEIISGKEYTIEQLKGKRCQLIVKIKNDKTKNGEPIERNVITDHVKI